MNVNGNNSVAKVEERKVAAGKPRTLGDWLGERKADLMKALPKGTVEIDRFMQSAMLAITNPKNPDLLRCNKDSLARSLKEAASYGLELNGTLGQAYLIPYNESVKDPKTGQYVKEMTAHFQMGYKGLISLARRSNTIKTIAAECIYENDDFSCELASGRSIHHKMNIFQERGEVIGYYCLVELTNGGEQFAVMSKKDAEKFRDTYSKSYIMAKDKSQQNWGKNFDAMALKTVVIKALKLCPISIEALDAVSKEELKDIEADPIDVSYEEQIEKNSIVTKEEKENAVTIEPENSGKELVKQVQNSVNGNIVAGPEKPAENAMNLSADEEASIEKAFDSPTGQFSIF